jgi:signal transduction histidine kinase
MVTGDPTHMHQILTHLFRNAAKAIGPALGVALIGASCVVDPAVGAPTAGFA